MDTEDELKTRVEQLEGLVANLAQLIAFDQRLRGNDHLSNQMLELLRTFQRSNTGTRITIPEGQTDVKFYHEVGRKGNKKKVPSGVGLLPNRVATMLFNSGYESLHDLNGITLSQIFGINGFGPAAIRDFMSFIHHFLPSDCKTDQ